MDNEKRVRRRIDYKNHILCYNHIPYDKGKKPDLVPIRITIKNISYSGLGIISTKKLDKDDVLSFNLANTVEKREVCVQVVWCRYSNGEYEVGLKFINITKDTLLFLDRFIKSYLRQKSYLTSDATTTRLRPSLFA
ncbi:PilZ domain-containing protein [Vallitaleaceae bacterium 9-2]